MAIQKITSGIIQDGAIVAADIVSIANTQITGNIVSSQITSVANTQITGNIISSQITSIANTQITGNIAATNISGGSNGTIPYQSASGTTQMLAAGTSGYLLQANGVAAPTWVAASAGALTFLSSVTASNSATVDVENAFSTYASYLIIGNNLTFDNSGSFLCRLKIGGTYLTTDYSVHANVSDSDAGTYSGTAGSSQGEIKLTNGLGTAASLVARFTMTISDPSSTTRQQMVYWKGVKNLTTTRMSELSGIGGNSTTGALTGIRFYAQIGNIVTGTFRLYGISNS